MSDEMITISREEYMELLKDSRFLECLRAAGVDNWEGYDPSVDIFFDRYPALVADH